MKMKIGNGINTIDSSNIDSYGCYDCGINCIDYKYLKEKGEYFYSYVTKRRYKVKQNVICQSKNVICLVTCKKWEMQGAGETNGFKSQIIDLASKIKKCLVIQINTIEETNHSIEDFDVQIIVQLENVPRDKDQARKRRKLFKGY